MKQILFILFILSAFTLASCKKENQCKYTLVDKDWNVIRYPDGPQYTGFGRIDTIYNYYPDMNLIINCR